MTILRKLPAILVTGALVLFMGCAELAKELVDEDPTPTNELMEGVWKVTSVTDAGGNDVTDTVTSYFPQFIHLDNQNSVNSTLGPLFMYLVYGKSRLASITGTIDEVFKYVNFAQGNVTLTEGEWFIDKNTVTDKFTIEIKLRFPTMTTVNTVFNLFGLDLPEFAADAVDLIIYHTFMDVSIDIDDLDPDVMVWTFDDNVETEYNTKDNRGRDVMYDGVSLDSYSRCTIVFQKMSQSLIELVEEAATTP